MLTVEERIDETGLDHNGPQSLLLYCYGTDELASENSETENREKNIDFYLNSHDVTEIHSNQNYFV